MTAPVCGLGRLDAGLEMDLLLQEFDWRGITIANGIVRASRSPVVPGRRGPPHGGGSRGPDCENGRSRPRDPRLTETMQAVGIKVQETQVFDDLLGSRSSRVGSPWVAGRHL